jgi:hypothetical protein
MQFSLQEASPETFGYTLIHISVALHLYTFLQFLPGSVPVLTAIQKFHFISFHFVRLLLKFGWLYFTDEDSG